MRRVQTAVFVACLLATEPASASPEDLFGYGARTSAMGATGAAHATASETGFHNPALASTIRRNELTLGYVAGVFRLDAERPGSSRLSTDPMKGTVIGAALPIPLGGRFAHRVGAALALYTPTDVVARGRVLYPEKTQFPILGDRAQSVTVRVGLGVDVGYGLRLGAGIAALAALQGNVVAATDATGRVGTSVETQLVATYAPVFGATYDLPIHQGGATYRLGVAFRGTLDARFAVVIDGTKLSSLNIPLFNIAGIAQYDPAQVALELARIERDNVLALQVSYKRWSAFPGLLEPTVVCSEGGPGACGLLPPTIDWHDTVVVRAGADQGFPLARGLGIHARGGIFVESTPLPADLPSSEAFDRRTDAVVSVPTAYYDAARVGLTAGTGLALEDPLPPISLDAFAQYHVLLPRTVRSIDPSGATLLEGEAAGYVAVFGMTAGVKF